MDKRLVWVFLLVLVFFSGCKEDEIRTWTVHYEIYKYTNDPISYRVTYHLNNGSTKTLGPVTDFKWVSEDVLGVEEFSPISLSVEVLSGDDALMMQIYRDGALHEHSIKPKGTTNFTVDTIL